MNIGGATKYLVLTDTPVLNGENTGGKVICYGTNVCGGPSGNAFTKFNAGATSSVVIGDNAASNFTTSSGTASGSVILGTDALKNNSGTAIDTLVAIGAGVLKGETSSQDSTDSVMIGAYAYQQNTPPARNVAIGCKIAQNKPVTSAEVENVIVGANAFVNATQSGLSRAVVIGYNAFKQGTNTYSATNGSIIMGWWACATLAGNLGLQNVLIGQQVCAQASTVGNNNVMVGAQICRSDSHAVGASNVVIGSDSFIHSGFGDNAVIIGSSSFRATNQIVFANDTVCIGAAQTGIPAVGEVMIGKSCTSSGVVGKLSFGNGMESIKTTATAGANGAPPAQVAGYAPIRWNGTNYKIPVYLP